MAINLRVLDRDQIKRDPAGEGALDAAGRLQVLPHAFWQQFSQTEIAAFCHQRGLYCVPTTELIDWLNGRIGDRCAIEIGSGCGVLADALAIVGTDNRMQEWPPIRMQYEAMRQPIVQYGRHVATHDAQAAVQRYRPDVVIAAWVTHRWNEQEPQREGNMFGVEERDIVAAADYIHIGNRAVHRHKPILALAHEEYEFPWLVSRAMNGTPNYIAVWQKGAA